jgi:hypothetical protein
MMRISYQRFINLHLFIIVAFLFFSCGPARLVRILKNPAQFSVESVKDEKLKVHMKTGNLYLLDHFSMSKSSDTLIGYGILYSPNRDIIGMSYYNSNMKPSINKASSFQIPLSSVALFETNKIKGIDSKILLMSLVAVPTAMVSIYCLTNPKACFGSCPTFYAWDGKDTILMAEGFSSSILRAFEKRDIDMLYWAKHKGDRFQLRLTNEALETHVIRYADLLVLPRKADERVFATNDGKFYSTTHIRAPSACIAPEGNCLEAVRTMDHKERYSKADSNNLAQKEIIELSFDSVSKDKSGLIIGCRQTFLTTYLFYQSLAYLGSSAGYFASRIESGDESLQRKVNKIWEILGGIEIFFQNQQGRWEKVDQIEEMGPIATDVHLVPLPATKSENLKIRLRLTKGLWRIDYLALGKLEQCQEPIVIKPSRVTDSNGIIDENAKSFLTDTLKPLVTLPGDVYNIFYDLPSLSSDYELFLSSKGYYIEWMREGWLAQENPKKAAMMFGFPRLFMKTAASDFKLIEPSMEENFWRSRYVKKN